MEEWQSRLIELSIEYGTKILTTFILFLIGKWLINKFMNIVENWIQKKLDPTLQSFIKPMIRVIMYILLFITVASTLGIEMTSFVAVFGAAGLAVGLALQGSLANFAGGILILSFRPFEVGDFIETGNYKGKVKSIKILYTILNTRDNKTVIIPNGNLSNNSVINYSKEATRRVDLSFGVGYEDNIIQVKNILTEIVDNHEQILEEPEPIIRVAEHAESSINFNVLVWTESENYWNVYYDLMEEVKLVFDEKDINIPFPQRDVHLDQLQG
ncbi:MAG: mechanosensitive ion channel family protein [Bacillota bacterium]